MNPHVAAQAKFQHMSSNSLVGLQEVVVVYCLNMLSPSIFIKLCSMVGFEICEGIIHHRPTLDSL